LSDRGAVAFGIGAQRGDRRCVGAGVAEAAGDGGERLWFDRLDGLVVLKTNAVLNRAEKGVAFGKRARLRGGKDAGRLQLGDRRPRGADADARMRVTVAELEELDEELDVDQAAGSGLEVDGALLARR